MPHLSQQLPLPKDAVQYNKHTLTILPFRISQPKDCLSTLPCLVKDAYSMIQLTLTYFPYFLSESLDKNATSIPTTSSTKGCRAVQQTHTYNTSFPNLSTKGLPFNTSLLSKGCLQYDTTHAYIFSLFPF